MNIGAVPFTVTDWNTVARLERKGESGTSFCQTFEAGKIRIRRIVYSPRYRADHWCSRGHILYVLEGELTIHLQDGRSSGLHKGMSFQTGNDETNQHRCFSEHGAEVLIVD